MSMTQALSEYFDQVAGSWDRISAGYFGPAVREAAFAKAYLRPDMYVADVGAGTGFIAYGLVHQGVIGRSNNQKCAGQVTVPIAVAVAKGAHVQLVKYRLAIPEHRLLGVLAHAGPGPVEDGKVAHRDHVAPLRRGAHRRRLPGR